MPNTPIKSMSVPQGQTTVTVDLHDARIISIDNQLVEDSTNPVTSGAVYSALANIPSATVDQTYDPTSANAQSGVAIEGKKPGLKTTGTEYTIDGSTVVAGTGAEVFNDYSTNIASGNYSHAEGRETKALGAGSHAEGSYTEASGSSSHAEGFLTEALGAGSHAEGSSTRASGDDSHAEGWGTVATGDYSHSEGFATKAASAYQHVQGKYNVLDSSDKYAYIIGNGTAEGARHDAFAIDWNGLIYVNGSTTGVDVSQLTPVTVDTDLSSTSTNPVQNKAVTAYIAKLVNDGMKNLLRDTAAVPTTVNGITFSLNSGGTYTLNGTATASTWFVLSENNTLKAGSYVLTSGVTGQGNNAIAIIAPSKSTSAAIMRSDTIGTATFTEDQTGMLFALRVQSGASFSNLVLKPMLCTAEDYAISSEFVPYAPSNRELYELLDVINHVLEEVL